MSAEMNLSAMIDISDRAVIAAIEDAIGAEDGGVQCLQTAANWAVVSLAMRARQQANGAAS